MAQDLTSELSSQTAALNRRGQGVDTLFGLTPSSDADSPLRTHQDEDESNFHNAYHVFVHLNMPNGTFSTANIQSIVLVNTTVQDD